MVVTAKAVSMEEPKWTIVLAKNMRHVVNRAVKTLADVPKPCHNGRKKATILIYEYGSTGVLPLTCLFAWCMMPLLAPSMRANPCCKI